MTINNKFHSNQCFQRKPEKSIPTKNKVVNASSYSINTTYIFINTIYIYINTSCIYVYIIFI